MTDRQQCLKVIFCVGVIMMLYDGIQDDILLCGNYGCGFLCVCRAFELNLEDIPKLAAECQNNKSLSKDFYVNDWVRLLETLDPKKRKWTVEKTPKYKMGDILIGMYFNPTNNYTHFVLLNPNNKHIIFNSLKNSNTVKNGFIKDFRVCKVVG